MGRERGRIREKVQGIRIIIGRHEIDGKVKNSMGNGEVTRKLTCTIHGHELSGGGMLAGGGCRVEGEKGEKKLEQL